MHPFLEQFLARQASTGAADFAGADARVRIPVREGVLNEFLREMVGGGKRRHSESCA